MKIIAIKGTKNTGKTTTIKNILQKLCSMKGANLDEYHPAGGDKCDFDAVLTINGKIVVIRSYGDGITYIRDGLKFANDKNADVLLIAWNSDLDNSYELKTELPNAEVHNNPIQICEPLRTQWVEFSNLIAKKI